MKTVKRIVNSYIRIIQKVVVTVSLFLIYLLGFGLTRLFLSVFRRDMLRRRHDSETAWSVADGYVSDLDDSLRES